MATALVTAACGDDPVERPARPNIVLLLTDDQDVESLSVMPRVRSLLAAPGTSFSRYYASVAACCPSRATMLRGQYAHNTKIITNEPPNGGFARFHEQGLERSTLATWLRDAGYRTGLFGKYLNGYPSDVVDERYVPPGWDTWVSPSGGNPYYQYHYTLNENGRLFRHGQAPDDYLNDVLQSRVDDFLRAADRRPFFAFVSTYNPHSPATPAPRHRGLFAQERLPRPPSFDEADVRGKPRDIRLLPRVTAQERRVWTQAYRKRLRALQGVDEMVGAMIDRLKRSGALANTYFFFLSDNGYHIGQHRLAPGKSTAYEEDVRVPLVVRGPGVPAGRTVDHIAGNTDIAPTIADLAGVRPPAFVDGRSLAPLLRGTAPAPGRRTGYLLEHGRAPQSVGKPLRDRTLEAPEPYKPGSGPRSRPNLYLPPFEAVRTERHLYVEYVTGERELYDVVADPYQMKNIAARDRPTVKRLAAQLRKLRDCAAEACRAAESE